MALRILNNNHLSIVRTVSTPLARYSNRSLPSWTKCVARFSSSQLPKASIRHAHSDEHSILFKEAQEQHRRLFVRPVFRKNDAELQPKNLPEYGTSIHVNSEEHVRFRRADNAFSSADMDSEVTDDSGRYKVMPSASHVHLATRANYSTFSPCLQTIQAGVPVSSNVWNKKSNVSEIAPGPMRCMSLYNRDPRNDAIAPSTSTSNQVRFKSSRKKTTMKILEEWNKRSSQNFLRIDNILYKYKRKEMGKAGEMAECPSDKKKQKQGGKRHKVGKKKGTVKQRKCPKKKCKKKKMKCAGVELEREIERSLDELIGEPRPAAQMELVDAIPVESIDGLMESTPLAFSPKMVGALGPAGKRLFCTTSAVAKYRSRDSDEDNVSLRSFDADFGMVEQDLEMTTSGDDVMERADDEMAASSIKPLPAFIPMKIPEEAYLRQPQPEMPLKRLKKRQVYGEMC